MAVDYDGDKSFLHRCHRTRRSPNPPPEERHSRKDRILKELKNNEFKNELKRFI